MRSPRATPLCEEASALHAKVTAREDRRRASRPDIAPALIQVWRAMRGLRKGPGSLSRNSTGSAEPQVLDIFAPPGPAVNAVG